MIDFRTHTREDLITFVFDHPAAAESDDQGGPAWFWEDREFDIDPEHHLALVAAMLRDAGSLRTRFSPAQIEQGLWFLFGPAGNDWFGWPLARRETSDDRIVDVITSLHPLYADLLQHIETDTATFMLWDLLLECLLSPDDPDAARQRLVRETSLPMLEKILALDSTECQYAALHGLGHLRHEATPEVVRGFLASRAGLEPRLRAYAEQVRDGRPVL